MNSLFLRGFKKDFKQEKNGLSKSRIQDLDEKFIFERFLKRILNKKKTDCPNQESRIWRKKSFLRSFLKGL